MTEDMCPKCGSEVRLYTKPDGEYLSCTNCTWTSDWKIVKKEQR